MPCPRGLVIAAMLPGSPARKRVVRPRPPFPIVQLLRGGRSGRLEAGQKLRTLHKLQTFCKKGLDKAIDLWYNGTTSIG